MLIYRFVNNDRLPRQTDKKQKEDKLEQSKNRKNAVELIQSIFKANKKKNNLIFVRFQLGKKRNEIENRSLPQAN